MTIARVDVRSSDRPAYQNGTVRALSPLAVTRAYISDQRQRALLAPDIVLEGSGISGRLCGRESVSRYVEWLLGAIAVRESWIETGFESADRAAVVVRLVGNHHRQLWDLTPTGRSIEIEVTVLARVHAGMIQHLHLSFDRLALRQQITGQTIGSPPDDCPPARRPLDGPTAAPTTSPHPRPGGTNTRSADAAGPRGRAQS